MQTNNYDNSNIMIKNDLADEFVSSAFSQLEQAELACPFCSQRLSDLSETYFVGCPMCYKIFSKEVEKLATIYHGTCQHFGKNPIKSSKIKIENEIALLREDENKAVLARNYMLAEDIKRKIDALRGGE